MWHEHRAKTCLSNCTCKVRVGENQQLKPGDLEALHLAYVMALSSARAYFTLKSSSNKVEVATALPQSMYLTQGEAGSLLRACGQGETGGERG